MSVSAKIVIIDVGGRFRPAKNIIIMLGDGMGVAHRAAARIVRYGVTAGRPNGFLAMDQFPGTGLITTHSLNSVVTDSSPGMACYSTGNHADNNQEGVFPAHVTNPFYAPRVEYMAEYLHRAEAQVARPGDDGGRRRRHARRQRRPYGRAGRRDGNRRPIP